MVCLDITWIWSTTWTRRLRVSCVPTVEISSLLRLNFRFISRPNIESRWKSTGFIHFLSHELRVEYGGGAEGKNENLDSKKQVLWFSYFLQWSFFSIQRIKPKKLMRASVPNFIIQIRIFSKKWQKIFFL